VTVNLDDARRQWLSELYEANVAAVFNQCRRLLRSPEDAADATQEVFLRAAASLSEPPHSSEARRWLTTVARNYCIDVLRRRERFGTAVATLAATADGADEGVQSVEDRQLVLAVLQQMGTRERQALWQSAVEDLPVAEVAKASGLSYLAAAQLLHRARRQALVLATRLAVVLGLAALGRWFTRRSSLLQRSQQIAAVVAIPAVIGLAVVSSSPQPPIVAQATSPSPLVVAQSPVPRAQPSALPVINAPPPAPAPSAPAPTAAVLAAQVVVAKPPAPVVKPSPPPTVSDEKDHGKGRDRDDLSKKPKKH
jgi:RNA polymerase sigma-70 factor (ECF subfamily)